MATSLKDYLKKYQSVADEEKQAKKSKKKRKVAAAAKVTTAGLIIVDNDAAWQKNIDEDSDEPEVEEGDEPQVLEDVDVKRMHQMERVKLHRPYMSIGDDGSGWSTVDNNNNNKYADRKAQISETLRAGSPDVSPPRRDISPPRRIPSTLNPKPESDSPDISPPRKRRDTSLHSRAESADVSSPRRKPNGSDSMDSSPPRRRPYPSPNPKSQPESLDISPPRKRRDASLSRKRNSRAESADVSPPRRKPSGSDFMDSSPPRRKPNPSPNSEPQSESPDYSPPRKRRDASSPRRRNSRAESADVSPPRRKPSRSNSMDSSPPRRRPNPNPSPNPNPGKVTMTDGGRAGLSMSKAERAAELVKKKQEAARRLKEMDGGGRTAETIYRDKRGKRLEGLEELLRQQQGEVKPEVKPLEWGKGLAQKREVEEQHAELEAEKAKPFARSRDDPELDKVFKERLRWGDPMAHLVKRKEPAAELVDLGASEEMKESGFMIPQLIPQHSWLKNGVGAPMNRYGIKPGRHWDGVDRSTGFENQMFKAKAEKQATEMEAYLWSVSDM